MTGIVLAGGRSERMGADKALLRLNGETLLERAVALLQRLCAEVIVAVRPGQEVPQVAGCRAAWDEKPGMGPLAGLVAGLSASQDDWHLVLACDLPLVRVEVLRLLVDNRDGYDAVVPRAGGRLQPLVAAYSRACLEPGREALNSGHPAMAAMLDRVRARVLQEAEIRAVDPDLVSFVNVNTWEEFEAVRRLAAQVRQ